MPSGSRQGNLSRNSPIPRSLSRFPGTSHRILRLSRFFGCQSVASKVSRHWRLTPLLARHLLTCPKRIDPSLAQKGFRLVRTFFAGAYRPPLAQGVAHLLVCKEQVSRPVRTARESRPTGRSGPAAPATRLIPYNHSRQRCGTSGSGKSGKSGDLCLQRGRDPI
jgi:hypothetical protein